MTVQEVLVHYEARLRELQAGLEQARLQNTVASTILVIAIATFFLLGLFAIRQQVSSLWPSLPIPFVAVSARRFRFYQQSRYRLWRLQRFYEQAVQRIQGNWSGNGARGEEFNDLAHIYSGDLNVLGEGSLFELLCTARTAIGQRGLADYLLKAPPLDETLLRQEAVQELRDQVELRERIALLGKFEFFESNWGTFSEWLNSPTFAFSQTLRITTVITSILIVGLLLCALIGLVPKISAAICIMPLVGFHSVIGLLYRNRVNRTISWLRPLSVETQVLLEGLRLLEDHPFQSVKLRRLADSVRNGSKSVRKLELLLIALNERNKEWFYGPSLLLLVGTQLCMAIEHWRTKHQAALRTWLDAWAEFEALNALANYAYENPENTFPEFFTEQTMFEAEALGHPLLSRTACVRNDVHLNRDTRFYIVSGSNMSGKSTLLRAIGLNAVLAFAGAPVRAQMLRLSPLSVCASLSLVDSLLNGKSKFMAEVDRLRKTINVAIERPVLFLIDEIFSGTNSRDRRIAAEAVVRTLINRGAIGALSTHDLALSEIAASEELGGANVHTGSRDDTDPMAFDYRLKPGVTNEANALSIARLAGVPI